MSELGLPVLSGRRVLLRRPIAQDAAARLALGRDPEIHGLLGGSRSALTTLTREAAANWVGVLEHHPHAWVIDVDGLIGEVRLDNVNLRDKRASLAIAIFDKQKLGKGFGPEAMRLVLNYAFGTLGLHRIGLRVLAFNHRAIRAYQKCGFEVEGTERQSAMIDGSWFDDIMMGVLADDFVRGSL